MKKLILLIVLTLSGIAVQAQPAVTAVVTNWPKTYYEAFNDTRDATLVKGMTVVGTLGDQITYPVEVRAERLTSLQTSSNAYAVSIHTKVGPITQVDYIDYDELDALVHGITSIYQANATITPMDNCEVVIRTRSGLSILKVVKGQKTTIAMRSGGGGDRNEMAGYVLDQLGRLLVTAKSKMDDIAASGR